LTRKQEAFASEYLVDLNGTQAAIRAGYSPHTAGEQAYELLKLPDIAAAIELRMAQRVARVNMKADDVLHVMSLLSHSRIDHYTVDEDGYVTLAEGAPEGAMHAIQSVKRRKTTRTDKDGSTFTTVDVEIKLWDKVAPLRLMGRHVGLFPDRVEHTGPYGGPIETITRIERVVIDLPWGSLVLRGDTEPGSANPARDEQFHER
jgi:phage terminase small subunit